MALGTLLGSVNMTGTPTIGPRLSVNVAATPVANAVPALVVIDVGATATLTPGITISVLAEAWIPPWKSRRSTVTVSRPKGGSPSGKSTAVPSAAVWAA